MNIPLTPLDGRYYSRVSELVDYLSEDALIKYRVRVELAWLHKITEVLNIDMQNVDIVCDDTAVVEIKALESELKHDVKAVEVWISRQLPQELVPYVHFGRTSEDINSIAYGLMIKDAVEKCIGLNFVEALEKFELLAEIGRDMPMMARTHGQPASPTTFGKEMAVVATRLKRQIENIQNINVFAKCGGATGTMAADYLAFPDVDWMQVTSEFVGSLGLVHNPITTQIEPHDWIARLSNELSLANTILIDACRDLWQYISLRYVKQKAVDGEVGSSTMPHKVNPIDFENAEANFGLANALLRHFAEKLPISRLQRDLSDSSVMRAHSEAYGHMLLALKSLKAGLSKIHPDAEFMRTELDSHWELLTEAVQTVMRKNGIVDAYDQMKHLSRGKDITKESLHDFIQNLSIDESDKQRLLELTPATYIGCANRLF